MSYYKNYGIKTISTEEFMPIILRHYQNKAVEGIYEKWNQGFQNVLLSMCPGTGKTKTSTAIIEKHNGFSMCIVHRQELVDQISLTLAERGVYHSLVISKSSLKSLCQKHVEKVGKCYVHPNAKCYVASQKTLLNRVNQMSNIIEKCTLWMVDEAHHVLQNNEYGKLLKLLKNAKGLGLSGTINRGDGMGLGAHHDGVFHAVVEGPSMRWHIDNGDLCDYRIVCPSYVDMGDVKKGKTGDWSKKAIESATDKSQIIADIASTYVKHAEGKLGLTYVPSRKMAQTVAEDYRQLGIHSEAIDGTTPKKERDNIRQAFENREIMNLVNVDLFSEGVDIPGIEVISMARKTGSLPWYIQAVMRGFRPDIIKQYILIIDHVGNVLPQHGGHGLPDAVRMWSLDRRDKRSGGKDDVPAVTVCTKCTGVYTRYKAKCPYCKHIPVPIARAEPDQVDGDLVELDPSVLAQMRGEIEHADRPPSEVLDDMLSMGKSGLIAGSAAKQHRLKQEAQEQLRAVMRAWGDDRRAAGWLDSESYRYFFLQMGVDVMTAQTLKRKDTEELIKRMGKLPWNL